MTLLTKRDKRKILKLLLALILSAATFYLSRQSVPPEVLGTVAPGYYRVTQVADGDTIIVDMDGKDERIRLVGVDTPETQDPRKNVQCFGHAASNFTKQLIGSHAVRLVADELSSNRDRYNRLLRYVYLPDGRLVQAEIIKQGYGFAYTSFPFTKSEEFKAYETTARQQNTGLWSSCKPAQNQYGGYTSNDQTP